MNPHLVIYLIFGGSLGYLLGGERGAAMGLCIVSGLSVLGDIWSSLRFR